MQNSFTYHETVQIPTLQVSQENETGYGVIMIISCFMMNKMQCRGFSPVKGIALLFISLLIANGCDNDSFNSVMDDEKRMPDSYAGDSVPVPGNTGLITPSDITSSGLKLTWHRAVDNLTEQTDLRYRVYRSTANDIDTVADAEINGTLVADWAFDLISVQLSGLQPRTTYYLNVIVIDEDGYKAAYRTVSVTNDGVLYLFSAGTFQGNMTTMWTASPRGDLDSYCSSSATYAALSCNRVRAFISISNNDSIRNMPLNYNIPTGWEIRGPDGDLIAKNWDDLFDHSVDPLFMDLQSANVADGFWWSGSDTVGSYDALNSCNGWTGGFNTAEGRTGAHNRTDVEWVYNGVRGCNNSLHLLCIGWKD
jgi:hypothetical protein